MQPNVAKAVTIKTPLGLSASYSLSDIGPTLYQLSFEWRATGSQLELESLELRMPGSACAVYRASPRSGKALALDLQGSGPPWFLDDLPLRLGSSLMLFDQDILATTAEEVNAALQDWNDLYAAKP